MSLALQELTRSAAFHPDSLAAFLREHQFPLVEGRNVSFVYRGRADDVRLRHWIYGLGSSLPFQRLAGTELWFLTIDLPEKSRVEYKLEVSHRGRVELLRDPLNPHTATDPYGANSVVYGAGYEEPEWVRHDPVSRAGSFAEHVVPSKALGDRRQVRVYLPARFRRTRRYPLLIVHDGPDYLRYANLGVVLDNLIHRLEVHSLVAVHVSSPARLREYAADRRHSDFLAQELVPFLENLYPLVGTPQSRSLMGASFGAVASLAAAWHHQGFFGNLLLQSGSFAFTDIGEHDRGPVFDPVVQFMNAFRATPGRPAERLYLSCGTYESLIYYNRSMIPLLQSTGMALRFDEARDGHNWENWRDRLRDGLSWLIPGPLWLVYE